MLKIILQGDKITSSTISYLVTSTVVWAVLLHNKRRKTVEIRACSVTKNGNISPAIEIGLDARIRGILGVSYEASESFMLSIKLLLTDGPVNAEV